MATTQTFRIILTLPEPEAITLARLAESECRDIRGQALYLLLKALAEVTHTEAPTEAATSKAEELSHAN